MQSGEGLEVQVINSGASADIKARVDRVGYSYLGTEKRGKDIKYSNGDDQMVEKSPEIVSNEEVEEKLTNNLEMTLLDVREPEEFALNHIPEAINIPLGDVENRASELDKEKDIYIICRTGNRSDMLARILATLEFKEIFNVVPGMIQWTGETESSGQDISHNMCNRWYFGFYYNGEKYPCRFSWPKH